ncbi:hypothetical protein FIBSPDRAFT_947020 [Athelia psychrophila]|uniref:Mitochondrial ATP synthase epsilon chain domain-containing protein n=1 Tax=Athelia psychrophila TaxID=1759441 RepID=A0A166S4N0_9AGAM|nr:hypothetical protein FIBSPDRAFT_947020 [Fibularhizoctonia sp. CBS 109695]
MSSATWRGVFTYNKYTSIAAQAVRRSLKEEHRVATDKHGLTSMRYQYWENGKGGEQVFLNPQEDQAPPKKSAAV